MIGARCSGIGECFFIVSYVEKKTAADEPDR